LQKLITAADGGSSSDPSKRLDPLKKGSSGTLKKRSGKGSAGAKGSLFSPPETTNFYGLKWPDFKNPGVTTRSGRMKLPVGIGQKKTKVVEAMLKELNVDPHPHQNEAISLMFNDLRSDIILHYELKSIQSACEVEIQSLKHQYEAIEPGSTLEIPKELDQNAGHVELKIEPELPPAVPQPETPAPVFLEPPPPAPSRKRKAALEQGNVLRRLKNK